MSNSVRARPADQAGRASHGASICVESPPSGDHPSRKDLRSLTKPQLRILLETAKVPEGARQGYMVKGAQWPPVLRLRHLGLIYVDRFSGHFCRDTMWLMPTDEGRVWAALASAGEAGTATTVQQGVVHEHAVPKADAQTTPPSSNEGKAS